MEKFLDRVINAINRGTVYIEILGVEYDLVQIQRISEMMIECTVHYYWPDEQVSEYSILIPYPVLKSKLQRVV